MNVAAFIAIGAAGAYGVSDFLAGVLSRRAPVPVLMAFGQAAGLMGLALALVLFGTGLGSAQQTVWGLLAGVGEPSVLSPSCAVSESVR